MIEAQIPNPDFVIPKPQQRDFLGDGQPGNQIPGNARLWDVVGGNRWAGLGGNP